MKRFFFSLIATIAGLALLALAGCGMHYSEGQRTGLVQKVSQKGIVCKSFEGELVMDGIRARGDSGITNVWKFSVLDPNVVKQLNDAAESGQRVTVTYDQVVWPTWCTTDTSYRITSVRAAKVPPAQ